MAFRIIAPPESEPISIEDCRMHLRLIAEGSPPEHPHDPMILAELSAAREWAENFTGRALALQTLEIGLATFPCCPLALPRGPVAQILSIVYLDALDEPQTLDPTAYQLDPYSEPPLLSMAPGAVLPATSDNAVNAVFVRYQAGYSPVDDSPRLTSPLPASIRAALLLILGDLYENAEDASDLKLAQIPRGAEALLRPYRLESSLA